MQLGSICLWHLEKRQVPVAFSSMKINILIVREVNIITLKVMSFALLSEQPYRQTNPSPSWITAQEIQFIPLHLPVKQMSEPQSDKVFRTKVRGLLKRCTMKPQHFPSSSCLQYVNLRYILDVDLITSFQPKRTINTNEYRTVWTKLNQSMYRSPNPITK